MTTPAGLVVGAALVDDLERPTRLLAARRTAPAALAGRWELPGGKVEPGEEALAALHRELHEELGVHVSVGAALAGPLPGGAWSLGETHCMLVWRAVVTSGTPTPLQDHDRLRWLAAAELDDVPWVPADRPIVAALGLASARG